MEKHGDADGDGFLEYRRRRDSGLVNQGWKDSNDAVFHADGQLADAPIALCEVQGYAFLALTWASRLASVRGDASLTSRLAERARLLREKFEAQFWDEELGIHVLALDGAKQPCRVRASNAGQLLFTGIVAPERAAKVAATLTSSEFLTSRRATHHRGAGSGHPHGSAPPAGALLRHAAPSRQGADSLSRGLLAACLGRGRAVRDVAGLPRSRDRRVTTSRSAALSEAAGTFTHVGGSGIAHR
jgi:hypothetical protein